MLSPQPTTHHAVAESTPTAAPLDLAAPPNLLAMPRDALETWFEGMGARRFHARQVLRWIYKAQVTDLDAMTDLAKPLRLRLRERARIAFPTVAQQRISADGTIKWLFRLACGNCIESVFIPESGRGTLCVSSQVGCSLNCDFCATARQGFNRNLQSDEIVAQVWLAQRALANMPATDAARQTVTNVVLMGMGEPLLNFDNVVAALRILLDDHCFGLSKRRVTLSTAGVVPGILRLGETCPVSLAVSLHAPDDELRTRLVPLNKKYPIAELLAACRRYVSQARMPVTLEYVMLDGVNDSPRHAHQLARLLGDLRCKVNLIPFNPSLGIRYARSRPAAIERFRELLMQKDIFTVTRKTRGDDIDAACGQLAGKFQDRTRRAQRLSAKTIPTLRKIRPKKTIATTLLGGH